jgi:hypothetical protein
MSTMNVSMVQSSSNNPLIMEFFIFNRQGVCLTHLDFQDESLIVSNKALSLSSDKNNENRYKLIFGLLFSMKSFVKNLSPNKTDFFKSFLTRTYKLHYIELLNGLRFCLFTTPMKMDLGQYLKEIYVAFYVTFISRNILQKKDEPIKNEVFLELVHSYLTNLNSTIN